MIIEYNDKYIEEVKDLYCELQTYIAEIDKEKYNVITPEFRDNYFIEELENINKNNGKILLYVEDDKVLGLISGIVYNDERDEYDFKCPKRGRICDLIVNKNYRGKNIGTILLKSMEDYLHKIDCKKILIGVFAYNEKALKFYEKNGYHLRMTDMIEN